MPKFHICYSVTPYQLPVYREDRVPNRCSYAKELTQFNNKETVNFWAGEGGVQTFVSNTVISSLGIPVLMLKLGLFIFMYRLSSTYLPAYIRSIWPRSPAISGRFAYLCALYSVSSCMRGKWGRVFIAFSMFFPHSPIP